MKLRLIQIRNERRLLCPNGSIIKVDSQVLRNLLTDFKKANAFKGDYGYWNTENATMDAVYGQTLAFVDDANKLVIISDTLFSPEKQIVYVSATEYAKLHGKSRPSVKNMCAEGRILGAYKTSSGWLIPKDSPYPERKRKEIE